MWLVEWWSGMDIVNCVSEGGEGGCRKAGWLAGGLPLLARFSLQSPLPRSLSGSLEGSPQFSQALSSAGPGWEALDPMEGRGKK